MKRFMILLIAFALLLSGTSSMADELEEFDEYGDFGDEMDFDDGEEEIQDITDEYIKKCEQIVKDKKEEIMSV